MSYHTGCHFSADRKWCDASDCPICVSQRAALADSAVNVGATVATAFIRPLNEGFTDGCISGCSTGLDDKFHHHPYCKTYGGDAKLEIAGETWVREEKYNGALIGIDPKQAAAPDSKVDGMESRLSKVIDQCHEEWLADGTVKEKAAASAVQGTREPWREIAKHYTIRVDNPDYPEKDNLLISWAQCICGAAKANGTREYALIWAEHIEQVWRAALQAERGGDAPAGQGKG